MIVHASPPQRKKPAATRRRDGGLVNRAAVRRLVMDTAANLHRDHVIVRVGTSVYTDCERVVRQHVAGLVSRHPSAYATLEAGS